MSSLSPYVIAGGVAAVAAIAAGGAYVAVSMPSLCSLEADLPAREICHHGHCVNEAAAPARCRSLIALITIARDGRVGFRLNSSFAWRLEQRASN